ncbi:MAG: hypothetical protein RL253_694, partial [Bacteroidota bacterium]
SLGINILTSAILPIKFPNPNVKLAQFPLNLAYRRNNLSNTFPQKVERINSGQFNISFPVKPEMETG